MPPVGARSVAAPLRPLFGWSISTTTGPAALATGKEADGWESASCRSPRLESTILGGFRNFFQQYCRLAAKHRI
jgi:hypothetical protein